jgi:hypothetical protein
VNSNIFLFFSNEMCQAQQKEFNPGPGHAQGLVRGSVEREWADGPVLFSGLLSHDEQ